MKTLRQKIEKILTYTPKMSKQWEKIAKEWQDDCPVCGRPFRINKQREIYVDQLEELFKQTINELISKKIDEFIWGIEDDNVIEYFQRFKDEINEKRKKMGI